jgi:predicted permease
LLRRRRIEAQLDAELRDHIERQVADYMSSGLSKQDAVRQARLDLGGIEQVKELCRDVRGARWLEELAQDARYGLRILRKQPSFTIAAVLSLALGIAASTAIFTLIDATLLKSLPVREPHRLVELLTDRGGEQPGNAFSNQALTAFRDRATTTDIIASHQWRFFVVIDDMPPEQATGQYVTGDYFAVLGIHAAHGRTIAAHDDAVDAPPVAVLGHAYWQRRFNGDRSVIGRPLKLDDHLFTIVGVAPASFRGLVVARDVDFWLPLAVERSMRSPTWTASPGYKWLQVVGRVKDGYSLEQAGAELSSLFHDAVIEPELTITKNPGARERYVRWRLVVEPARTGLAMVRQQYGEPLMVVLAISVCVLVIACVNVANLLLARVGSRRHEVAVRVSLGARRARIVRQLLTESVLLSAGGAILGLGLAYAACRYLVGIFAVSRTPLALDVTPDVRVLAFATTLTLVTALGFGIAPSWNATQATSPASSLQSGRRVVGRRNRGSVNRSLVIAQITISVVMLFCGGLFLRSLQNIRAIDTGFESHAVLLIEGESSLRKPDPDRQHTIVREIVTRLTTIAGVRAASVAEVTPIQGGGVTLDLWLEPYRDLPRRQAGNVYINWVGPGYLSTMTTPIHAGRDFTWQDSATSPKVALLNRTAARRYFADHNPIGSRINDMYEVVGVVGDAKYLEVRESIQPTVYLHWFQQTHNVSGLQFTIRTDGTRVPVAAMAREVIREVAPTLAVTKTSTLDEQVDASIVRERMLSILSGWFACLGLTLAAIGLYGVMAYSVARRTSEIGIRMALGAAASQIAGMVVREALLLTVSGIVIGIGAALLISRTLAALLFDVQPNDPLTALAVVVVMVATGLVATYAPSRRAVRIEPTVALRTE